MTDPKHRREKGEQPEFESHAPNPAANTPPEDVDAAGQPGLEPQGDDEFDRADRHD